MHGLTDDVTTTGIKRRQRRLTRAGRFLRCERAPVIARLGMALMLMMLSISPGEVATGAEPVSGVSTTGVHPETIAMRMMIDQLIPNDGGVYGVVVIDPERNLVYSHNPTVPFISASLYKLPLMAHIYLLIEQGSLHLTSELVLQELFWWEGDDSYYDWSRMGMTTTVEEALFAAGAWSSNVAAWALATLTTWPEVEATSRAIGMVDTHMFVSPYALPSWPPLPGVSDSPESFATALAFIDGMAGWGPVMITTPRDIATFFSGLLAGQVVSVGASWAMIDILAGQAISDRFPQLLPAGTWLAHKTGNLEQVIHDAGIIYTGAGPVILVGMVEASPDPWLAISALQHLALTVYETYRA